MRPCVPLGGCHQVASSSFPLCANQPLLHSSGISVAARAVVYMSLQWYKREFSRNRLSYFKFIFLSPLSGKRVPCFLSFALQLPSCPSPQPDHDPFSSVALPACPGMTPGLQCSLFPPPLYIQLIAGLSCYSCGRAAASFAYTCTRRSPGCLWKWR